MITIFIRRNCIKHIFPFYHIWRKIQKTIRETRIGRIVSAHGAQVEHTSSAKSVGEQIEEPATKLTIEGVIKSVEVNEQSESFERKEIHRTSEPIGK